MDPFSIIIYNSQVENNSIVFEECITSINFSEGYHMGTGKSVSKEVQKSVQLFSDLVDTSHFDFLQGLAESPVVDLLMDYDRDRKIENWVSVNIQPGSFPKGKEHLQDFGFTLLLPKTFTQTL